VRLQKSRPRDALRRNPPPVAAGCGRAFTVVQRARELFLGVKDLVVGDLTEGESCIFALDEGQFAPDLETVHTVVDT